MQIVLVDPSKSFRAVLKSVLSESPVEWVEFTRVDQLNAWLQENSADIILTAKELEDGSFRDIVRFVRSRSRREYVPIYLFSSDSSEELLTEAFALGVTDVFEKQQVALIVNLLKGLAFFSDIARGGKVLLVEDDTAVSMLYSRELGRAGLEVVAAEGSTEALAILEDTEVDLVVTDLNLKEGELGQHIVRSVRRSQSRIEGRTPILVLTGSNDDQHKTGLFFLGADDYLVKPVDTRQLVVRCIQLIEKYRIHKQLREQMESYRTQALYDSLTGCHNRYGFLENAVLFVERCRREKISLAVLYIDLDNFKTVNDTLGHDTGDRVLTMASELIRGELRGQDLLTRWGGDEFVVLLQLHGEDQAYARAVAENLLSGFAEQREALHGVGCSVGLCRGSPQSMDALMDMVDRADTALYESKRGGKGRVSVAD